ncbi:hypothetical protein SAMN05444008_1044 [Cnuella takakiae]|uniref:Uncharacterized protein n=1 Tax=Cnuella takakiae TaxID=1302690 RepID=A0A1M4XQI7_9BACT|nr:hypothetical protein SAMN05444008_1044 [Cnuella takakiae]
MIPFLTNNASLITHHPFLITFAPLQAALSGRA